MHLYIFFDKRTSEKQDLDKITRNTTLMISISLNLASMLKYYAQDLG